MLSFNFANKNSYSDYGIIISQKPSIPSPKKKISYVEIPGRDSSLRYDEGAYDDISIILECQIKNRINLITQRDLIKAWLLSAGESDLVFSFDPNKKYRAHVANTIDFKQVLKYSSQFPIIMRCRPFKYSVDNSVISFTQTPATIENIGTLDSEPVISIYGTGDITLNINSKEIKLKSIANKVIINSEIQDAYDDAYNSLNEKMTGEFPKLIPGNNTITWIGNVSKLEVLPNWRWL